MSVGRILTADQVLHEGDVVSRSDGFGTTATRTPVSRSISINSVMRSLGRRGLAISKLSNQLQQLAVKSVHCMIVYTACMYK